MSTQTSTIYSRRTIDEFLAQKRIAFVGLSRDPKHFSRLLFKELASRGYDLIPVNPNAVELEGRRCYRNIIEIDPVPDAALLLTTPDQTDEAVRECAASDIRHVWMYRATGKGAVSPIAVEFCQQNGIAVIAGECPFMFLPQTQWFHRLHGGFNKLVGLYPKS